jgi:cytochrome d ubiquinol oxidase subunit II
VVSLVALVLVVGDAPRLWLALISLRAGPVLLAGVLLAPASAGALWRRRYHLARALGVGEVVFLLFAWALAQWPYIIYPDVSLHAPAAPPPTLTFLVATLPLGMGLVLPSLWLLFRVFRRHPPHAGRHGAPGVALAPGAEQS